LTRSTYASPFAARIRDLCPNCPEGRQTEIAEHAYRRYSGRIGRTSDAKALDDEDVRIAVVAHTGHAEPPLRRPTPRRHRPL
jgi:hypothetical protein